MEDGWSNGLCTHLGARSFCILISVLPVTASHFTILESDDTTNLTRTWQNFDIKYSASAKQKCITPRAQVTDSLLLTETWAMPG